MKMVIEVEFGEIGEWQRAGVRAVENLMAYAISDQAQRTLMSIMDWLSNEGVSLKGVSVEYKHRATYSDGTPIEMEATEVEGDLQ